MIVYLGGPIDGIDPEYALGWREQLDPPTGVLLFNPATAWRGANKATAQLLDMGNRAMIERSGGCLFNMSGPGRGVGSFREIEYARSLGRHVVVVGNLEQSLMAYDLCTAETVEEGLLHLLETNAHAVEVGRNLAEGMRQIFPFGFPFGPPAPGDDQ